MGWSPNEEAWINYNANQDRGYVHSPPNCSPEYINMQQRTREMEFKPLSSGHAAQAKKLVAGMAMKDWASSVTSVLNPLGAADVLTSYRWWLFPSTIAELRIEMSRRANIPLEQTRLVTGFASYGCLQRMPNTPAEVVEAMLEFKRIHHAWRVIMDAVSSHSQANNIFQSVPNPNVREAWGQLNQYLLPETQASQATLLGKMQTIQQGRSEKFREFWTRFVELNAQLEMHNMHLQEPLLKQYLCAGIHDRYSERRRELWGIMQTSPLMDLGPKLCAWDDYDSLMGVRHGRPADQPNNPASHHTQVDTNKDANFECWECGQKGHRATDCPNKTAGTGSKSKRGKPSKQKHKQHTKSHKKSKGSTKKQSGKQCYWCGKMNHTKDECYSFKAGKEQNPEMKALQDKRSADGRAKKKNSAEANHAGASSSSSSAQQHDSAPAAQHTAIRPSGYESLNDAYHTELAAVTANAEVSYADDELLMDTCSSDAMITMSIPLKNGVIDHESQINMASHHSLKSPMRGTITIRLQDGSCIELPCLQHKQLRRNLVGVNQLIKIMNSQLGGEHITQYDADKVTVIDKHTGAVKLTGGAHPNGLYFIKWRQHNNEVALTTVQPAAQQSAAHQAVIQRPRESVMLMHLRLGHSSMKNLRALSNSNAVQELRGVRIPSLPPGRICTSCVQAKEPTRGYHTVPVKYHAKAPLERLHVDVKGPIRVADLEGHRYWLIVLDEYSKYLWIRLMFQKGDAAAYLMEIITWIIATFGRAPQTINSDRGGEFLNAVLDKFMTEHYMKRSVTLPGTPQMNPVERYNRTVAEGGTVLLVHAHAPTILWGEAAVTAVRLYNMTHIGDDSRVPMQRLMGQTAPVSVKHLRVWGCDVFWAANSESYVKHEAMTPKTQPGILVGYAALTSGYRVIAINDNNLFVHETRNVTFVEDSFKHMDQFRRELALIGVGISARDTNVLQLFGELTEQAEMELAKKLSLETLKQDQPLLNLARSVSAPDEDEEYIPQSASAIPAPPSSSSAPRRSARVAAGGSKPPSKYGLINYEKDVGMTSNVAPIDRDHIAALHNAIASGNAPKLAPLTIELIEDIGATGYAHKIEGNAAARQGVEETAEQRAQRIALREQAREAFMENAPFPPARRSANRAGSILTPSQQCIANTKSGNQCRRRTLKGAYCFMHMQALLGLRIKMSTIPNAGNGLFAARDFRAGEEVCKYTGDISHDPEVDHGGSRYVTCVNPSCVTTIDAARTNTHYGRFINAPRGTRRRTNCRWVNNQAGQTVRIVTTKPVKKGDEFLIGYGVHYWERVHEIQDALKGDRQAKRVIFNNKVQHAHYAIDSAAFRSDSSDDEQPGAISTPTNLVSVLHASSASSIDDTPLSYTSDEDNNSITEMCYAHTPGLHAHVFVAATGEPDALRTPDPRSYEEAMSATDKQQWKEAMEKEVKSLMAMDVFKPVHSIPTGARPMDTKWVYKKKYDAAGKYVKHKARLTARGFTQREGIEYDDTFSPVMQIKSLRMLCAIVAALDLEFEIKDVETAFLHAKMDKLVFIQTPRGFNIQIPFLQLLKAIYGLKQAGRLFNKDLVNALVEIGYTAESHVECCILTRLSKAGRPMFIAVWVDDMPYAYDRRDKDEMDSDWRLLKKRFKINDLGPATSILGIRIKRDRAHRVLTLDLQSYTEQLLAKYPIGSLKTSSIPEAVNYDVDVCKNWAKDNNNLIVKPSQFRQFVGEFAYLSTITRPDIAHAVNMLQRMQDAVDGIALKRAEHLLRYIKGTAELGLRYAFRSTGSNGSSNPNQPRLPPLTLVAFTDSDFAEEKETRLSTTGIFTMLNGMPIHWIAQRQKTVSMSSSEAEYKAAGEAAREVIWERRLLAQLKQAQPGPTELHIDNNTTIQMVKEDDGESHSRRKHIDVIHHKIREWVKHGEIQPVKIDTQLNSADIFTKALPRPAFQRHRNTILGHFVSAGPLP